MMMIYFLSTVITVLVCFRWPMFPQTINAMYQFYENEIGEESFYLNDLSLFSFITLYQTLISRFLMLHDPGNFVNQTLEMSDKISWAYSCITLSFDFHIYSYSCWYLTTTFSLRGRCPEVSYVVIVLNILMQMLKLHIKPICQSSTSPRIGVCNLNIFIKVALLHVIS